MPQEIPATNDKKYQPPKPFRDHSCSTNMELEELCDDYGLLIECPREAKVEQIRSYESFRDQVHFVISKMSLFLYIFF